ncbi:hypothetical protein ACWPOB_13355 [Rhodococcus sp. 2H158]
MGRTILVTDRAQTTSDKPPGERDLDRFVGFAASLRTCRFLKIMSEDDITSAFVQVAAMA